jgi:hypothetical protein
MKQSPISKEYREQKTQVYAWLLLEWLQDPIRKPARVAFTEGPLRVIATTIERTSELDARKYRALLNSLDAPRNGFRSTTYMPKVFDALHDLDGDGSDRVGEAEFDSLMDRALRDGL